MHAVLVNLPLLGEKDPTLNGKTFHWRIISIVYCNFQKTGTYAGAGFGAYQLVSIPKSEVEQCIYVVQVIRFY